jgi:hypothetical protein
VRVPKVMSDRGLIFQGVWLWLGVRVLDGRRGVPLCFDIRWSGVKYTYITAGSCISYALLVLMCLIKVFCNVFVLG